MCDCNGDGLATLSAFFFRAGAKKAQNWSFLVLVLGSSFYFLQGNKAQDKNEEV